MISGQNEIEMALSSAAERIHATGFYPKLRDAYPKRIAEVNAELDGNWSLDGVRQWEDRIMKGINKIRGGVE